MSHGILHDDVVLSTEGSEWHGFAKRIAKGMSVRAAALAAGLDRWTVQLEEIVHRGTVMKDYRAAVRSDGRTFGVVGAKWTPVQPMEQVAFAEVLTEGHAATVSALGTFFGGEDVAITMELPTGVKWGRDEMRPYFLLSNNNAGRRGFRAGFCATRTICNNTHQIALAELNGRNYVNLRHTTGIKDRMQEAKRILGLAQSSVSQLADEMKAWSGVPLNDRTADAYYARFAPSLPEKAMAAIKDDKKRANAERANVRAVELRKDWWKIAVAEAKQLKVSPNLWLGAQSVTNWAQHTRVIQGSKTDTTNRAWVNAFGTGADYTENVLQTTRQNFEELRVGAMG